MAIPTCEICSGALEKISSKLLPEYQLSIDFSGSNLNLPPHLLHMHMIGLGQVVRCALCNYEDEPPPIKLFNQIAHIKAFQAMPNGVSLRIMRDYFGNSRQWLAEFIGYESQQTIYRFEMMKMNIPEYARRSIVEAFLHIARIENSDKEWYFNPKDWHQSAIELTEENKIIVPLPIQLCLVPDSYDNRCSVKVKYAI